MTQLTSDLAAEYERIRGRTQEDPGTAGAQGEENWAAILREWLPSSYHVVTKGRLLAHDGSVSRQVDVIALRPSYPPALRDKKYYLLDGVAAAFECKTTLNSGHLTEAAKRCKEIKRLTTSEPLQGTPWKELRGGVIYGILAHSHGWRRGASSPKSNVTKALQRGLLDIVEHPRERLDVVCVADLGTWHSSVFIALASMFGAHWELHRDRHGLGDVGGVEAVFFDQTPLSELSEPLPAPVGVVLATLYARLAQGDSTLRPIADYVRMANLYGSGEGAGRAWSLDIFSEAVSRRLLSGDSFGGEWPWGEWRPVLF
jgi:hypothetical protein